MEFTGFLLYASKHVKPFIIITPFFQHPKQNILLSSLTAPSDSPLLTPPSNPFRHAVSQGSESERRYFSVWTFFWLSHSGSLSSKSHLHYDSQSYGSDQNLISPSLLTPADFLASVVGCLMRIQAFTWTKQTLDCLPPTGMFPILVAHGKKKKSHSEQLPTPLLHSNFSRSHVDLSFSFTVNAWSRSPTLLPSTNSAGSN